MSYLDTSDWKQLGFLLNGYVYSIALSTACELDLFSWLSQHPGAAKEQIAEGLSLSTHSARVLLLACCASGLIERDCENKGYVNSPLAEKALVTSSPLNMIPFVHFNRQVQLRGCLHFTKALRENRNAGLDDFPGSGLTLYQRLQSHPNLELLFQEGMGIYTRLSPQMIEIKELAQVQHLLDVGGGDATTAIRLCQQYPSLKVSILELTSVCSIGQKNIESANLSHRIKYLEGDMFNHPWTNNCDGILMSHVVEILSLEKVSFLYQKAYEILPKNGRLFIWTLMTDDCEQGGLQAAKAAMYLFTVASGEGMPWPSSEHTNLLQTAGFTDIVHYNAQAIDHGAIVGTK
jgi:ubiquinone/menaquinone biosynthesis C-methylase UbiE